MSIRLDKFVSDSTGLSRQQARKAIFTGTVMVNGAVIKDIGAKVDGTEDITHNGNSLVREEFVYIMMNKPRGVLSASKDKRDVTAVDLVKEDFPRRQLFVAGRLDKTSTGLLLITDDGKFSHDILGPKNHVPKKYLVRVDSPVTDEVINAFKEGVVLADGQKMKSADISVSGDRMECDITLYQGVYHQIKRMLGVYDIGVVSLHRYAVGTLTLPEELGRGEYKKLTKEELSEISNLS